MELGIAVVSGRCGQKIQKKLKFFDQPTSSATHHHITDDAIDDAAAHFKRSRRNTGTKLYRPRNHTPLRCR